jgi:hypothetical protein
VQAFRLRPNPFPFNRSCGERLIAVHNFFADWDRTPLESIETRPRPTTNTSRRAAIQRLATLRTGSDGHAKHDAREARLHAELAAHHGRYAKRRRRRLPTAEHEHVKELQPVPSHRSVPRADRAPRTAGRHDRMPRSKQGGAPAGAMPPNVDLPLHGAGRWPDFPPPEQWDISGSPCRETPRSRTRQVKSWPIR